MLSRRVCVLACVREPLRGWCHPFKKSRLHAYAGSLLPRRFHVRRFGEESESELVIAPPPVLKPDDGDGGGKRSLCTSESFRGQKTTQGYGSRLKTWAAVPLRPTTAAPKADSVFDNGPRSRGFPYSS